MRQPAESSVPRHRTKAMTWSSESDARRRLLDSEFCNSCSKLALHSAEEARNYIGLLLWSRRHSPRANDYALGPFPCPHTKGLWHVGHNPRVTALLKGAPK